MAGAPACDAQTDPARRLCQRDADVACAQRRPSLRDRLRRASVPIVEPCWRENDDSGTIGAEDPSPRMTSRRMHRTAPQRRLREPHPEAGTSASDVCGLSDAEQPLAAIDLFTAC